MSRYSLPISTSIFKKQGFIFSVYLLAAAVACLAKVMLDFAPHDPATYISKVNNYIIFRNSFYHLIDHITLYGPHPAEQYDLYKYSPTFALLFAPFAILPVYVGVVVWSLFNAAMLFWAIRLLPVDENKKPFILWFILIELITSIQNTQVNPLIAALFIFTFVAFERKQIALAAFIVILSAFIKVYGVLGAALFLLYPERWKFIGWCIVWSIVLFAAPLLCISVDELLLQYRGWKDTITNDHETRAVDVSVMRMIMAFAHIPFNDKLRLFIQLAGILVFCIKYVRVKFFEHEGFRYFLLASIMIWAIVFNHLAESSTYIIAVTGVALWYAQAEKNKLNLVLLIGAFVLSSLSPTDVFPPGIRKSIIVPYALKALPCFLVWVLLEYKMLTGKFSRALS
jgi:hypothetical protein